MFVLKRKQVIIVCLALLVAMAGYLNWSYQGESGEPVAANPPIGEIHLVSEENEPPSDFFDAVRLEREVSRSGAIETLQDMIQSESTETSSKVLAEEQIISMTKLTDMEVTIESLIRAKGYEDAFVHINEDTVRAVVKSPEEFTEVDATQIAELITEQTGIPATNIKITKA